MKRRRTQVYLFGGLGNQLFQYFFGIFLSVTQDREVVYNDSLATFYGNNHGTLLSTKLKMPAGRGSTLQSRFTTIKVKLLGKLQEKTRRNFGSRFCGFYIAPNSGFIETEKLNVHSKHYVGYFQTWRYFEAIDGKNHFHTNLLKERSAEYIRIERSIKSGKSLGIHIRRGDYLALSDDFGILAIDYYKRALNVLEIEPGTNVFVFSDDIANAKLFLSDISLHSNWNYVEITDPLDSLLLLSECGKICISNSTFGYWAAMLGNARSVVAPAKWFRNLEDPRDLLHPSWVSIPSSWQD